MTEGFNLCANSMKCYHRLATHNAIGLPLHTGLKCALWGKAFEMGIMSLKEK